MTSLLALALGGCAVKAGRPAGPPTPAVSAETPSVASALPGATPVPPGRDDEYDDSVAAPPVRAARPVAAAFAAAWARSDLTAARWLAGVAPLCEPAFAAQLGTTDPAGLPATAVTGAPKPVREPAGGPAIYEVATDGGLLRVTVAAVAGRWLVSDTDFSRSTS